MKIILINLDRSPERLQSSKAWLDRFHLDFMRLPAVDGKQLSQEEFSRFVAERPMEAARNVHWTRGQAGCFLSHFKAWQIAAEASSRYTAIFEDDMHVSPALQEILQSDDWIPPEIDIVRLENTSQRVRLAKSPVTLVARRDVRILQDRTVYAGGYIISRSAAARLIAAPISTHVIADFYLFDKNDPDLAHQMTIAQIVPAVCIQDWAIPSHPQHRDFSSDIPLEPDQEYHRPPLWRRLVKAPRAFIRYMMGYRIINYVA